MKVGGIKVTTHSTGDSAQSIASGSSYGLDITPPEAGYVPIGWNISNILNLMPSLTYLNGMFRYNSSLGWRLVLANVGSENLTMRFEIKIAWAKE